MFVYHATPNSIPSAIKQQVGFVIFYPSPGSNVLVDAKSFKYDANTKLLSYKIKFNDLPIIIAEQPTPQNIIDIPQYYDKLIDSLSVYASFDSFYDKVSLTRPKEFKGQQSAVMNSKGTLMFAHPTRGDLKQEQWRKLFNGLEAIR